MKIMSCHILKKCLILFIYKTNINNWIFERWYASERNPSRTILTLFLCSYFTLFFENWHCWPPLLPTNSNFIFKKCWLFHFSDHPLVIKFYHIFCVKRLQLSIIKNQPIFPGSWRNTWVCSCWSTVHNLLSHLAETVK